jgi:large subunit ribosomal protein L10
MPTQKKIDQVAELAEKLNRATITVATDPSGQPVNTMTDLRSKMRERQVEYRVVKNTLAYLAADAANNPHVREIIQGPTALAFGYDNPVDVAKALEEYIRVNRSTLTIRGAVLNGKRLSRDEVITLSRLPAPEVLVGQLMGQLQAPISRFVGQLQAPLQRLLGALSGPHSSLASLLQQRVEQLRSQGSAT